MANLQAMVRSHYAAATTDLEGLLVTVNSLFYTSTSPNRFATMFFGKYDDATGELEYVNCGHNPPLLLRANNGHEWLSPTAMALGFSDAWTCIRESRCLEPGDVLVVYSDGVTEAWSDTDEEYGDARLLAVVTANRSVPAAQLAASIGADVKRFSPREQSDDWTLIAAVRKPHV
jgi:sigma-B regulation protein RsbU (phosphoserine phosphatase)